jgi:mRNA interferase MazF
MVIAPYRGEAWLADLEPTKGHEQDGRRPCLIISADKFNHSRAELVVVVPITKTDRRLPSHVPIEKGEGGLPEDSFAMCEMIRSISKLRLSKRYGKVSLSTIEAVEDRLDIILGFS